MPPSLASIEISPFVVVTRRSVAVISISPFTADKLMASFALLVVAKEIFWSPLMSKAPSVLFVTIELSPSYAL